MDTKENVSSFGIKETTDYTQDNVSLAVNWPKEVFKFINLVFILTY
jgi:hypothetical protein